MVRSFLISWSILVGVGLALSAAPVSGQDKPSSQPSYKHFTASEIQSFRQKTEKRIHEKVELEVQALDPESSQTTLVTIVELVLDETRFLKDKKAFDKKEQDRVSQLNNMVAKNARKLMDRISGKSKSKKVKGISGAKTDNGGNKVEGLKFGALNIHLDNQTAESILEDYGNQDQAPISLQLSMPDVGANQFNYNLMEYIAKIQILLEVPASLEDRGLTRIRESIVRELKLDRLKNYNSDWIEISRLPSPSGPGISDWVAKILDSKNITIPLILLGLMISVMGLMSSKMVTSSFNKIAESIRAMKPEENRDNSETMDVIPVAEEGPMVETIEEDAEEKAIANQMLSGDVENIRIQLAELLQSQAANGSSLILDLLYEQGGQAAVRDLISFMGYQGLKPALDLLPRRVLKDLRNFIEDSRGDQVNLKRGNDYAQRLYRDLVSRITVIEDEVEILDQVKKQLLDTDDNVLAQYLVEATPQEICLVLLGLDVERGNHFIHGIERNKLVDASRLFDVELSTLQDDAKKLISNLSAKMESRKPSAARQRRFVLRVVRQTDIDNEESTLALVDPDDWDLKREIIKIRFFVCQFKYVEPSLLKDVLGQFPLKERVYSLFNLPAEVKEAILNEYQEGSKLKEMLTTELNLVETSADETKLAKGNRRTLLERMASAIQKRLLGNPSLLDGYFKAEAKALNIEFQSDSISQEEVAHENAS